MMKMKQDDEDQVGRRTRIKLCNNLKESPKPRRSWLEKKQILLAVSCHSSTVFVCLFFQYLYERSTFRIWASYPRSLAGGSGTVWVALCQWSASHDDDVIDTAIWTQHGSVDGSVSASFECRFVTNKTRNRTTDCCVSIFVLFHILIPSMWPLTFASDALERLWSTFHDGHMTACWCTINCYGKRQTVLSYYYSVGTRTKERNP